jgi:Rieske Fe-S protein
MTDVKAPSWKNDYPIKQSREHAVCRRQFVAAACGCAVAVGAGVIRPERLLRTAQAAGPLALGSVDELAVGDYKLFNYPSEHEPCILVRLSENEFAAYSQSCTHLACPVHYQHEEKQFYCPCHEGFFSAEDGRVLAGPPQRPLPRYPVEVRDGQVWINSVAQIATL